MGFWLAGISLAVHGLENLPRVGAVFACNHTSNLEAPAVFLALRPVHPRLRVLYKAELRHLPILVWAFDVAGFVPVQRSNKDQSWPAVDRAADAIRDGNSFFIFPEGTRSRTGDLLPFKKGGFIMALKAQAPVVPVALQGASGAMRKGSPIIWPSVITVTLLPPVPTIGRGFDDRDALVAEVRSQLAGKLSTADTGPR